MRERTADLLVEVRAPRRVLGDLLGEVRLSSVVHVDEVLVLLLPLLVRLYSPRAAKSFVHRPVYFLSDSPYKLYGAASE